MSQAPTPLDGRRRRDVPLRISQVFSACTFCKARKIKCDGIAPICGGCTKFGRGSTCSLASKSLHGRDYPTHLQTRIQRLQAELKRGQHNSSSPAPHDCDASDDQGHQASMIDNLIAEIGALPILASSYASSFDGPSLSTVVLAAASKSPLSSLSSLALPSNPREFLPKQNTALKLVQHYITHIYPRLPFFSIQGFWAQFNHVYAALSIPLAGTMIQSPTYEAANGLLQESPEINRVRLSEGTSFFTVLLVLAISTSSLSRSTADPAKRLFHAAMTFREAAVLPNTIGGVQSILFLIQFATLNPSILDAWYLIGVGMRNCVDLGLHQDPSKSISPSLLETRRRLWWSMYSFDRSMSLGCGRPTEIADAVITARLPSFKIESSATEVEVEGYLQRYRVLHIQSLIYDRLNNMPNADKNSNKEIVVKLRAKLTAWRQDNSPLHSQTLVDSEWLMGKILLLRPCRRIPKRDRSELAELWESALGFVALYRQLVESNSIFYVQIASEKVYWTGLAMLYSYWRLRETVDGESDTTAIRPVDLWMAIQDVTFILRALSERWEDGKTLATEFEATSGRVVALMEAGGDADNLAAKLPVEVVNFKDYASLTSIRISATGARLCGMGIAEADDELQGLISEMISG
ncbi:fungal-specific transcription factor domain-containing protein [Dactylonectria estremocensis]|uniref:Fungal-specific transcription factor domain-containing protein n=1 Tax=Dactylonectria estremocensis TaxID=1079267 RepID=A0A9P9DJM1_9HYPO|nr:fungal-specific transcription factor domain-containing protein [Dactylonectria estremocensis]